MKKILITGASGFIGSFLVEEALKGSYDVYAGIRKSSSKNYLKESRLNLIELDFADINKLKRQLSNAPHFNYIIHCAGQTKALKYEDYYTANYQLTLNFIEALRNLNKVPEKFVYMSSLAAYGPGNPLSAEQIKITHVPRPVSTYGKSKLEAERFIISLEKFPYLIIRPTAVYGPRDKDFLSMFRLINNYIELLIGYNKQILTFVYVKDLTNAVFQLMESTQVNKGYFVTDGNIYDSEIFGNTIRKHLNKKAVRVRIPVAIARIIALIAKGTQYLSGQPSLINNEKINELKSTNWNCDISPLLNDVEYHPAYSLKDGIFETIEWYKREKWL